MVGGPGDEVCIEVTDTGLVTRADDERHLAELIGLLPREQAEVVHRRVIDHQSVDAIARELDVSFEAVKKRLFGGDARWRDSLTVVPETGQHRRNRATTRRFDWRLGRAQTMSRQAERLICVRAGRWRCASLRSLSSIRSLALVRRVRLGETADWFALSLGAC